MAIAGVATLLGAGSAALFMAASSPSVSVTDKAAIEKIVRDYILANPEILPEAMQNLQARELAKIVDENRKAIETPFAGAWEGAADGDVVVVEFFDYACGYCRAVTPTIAKLIAEDKKLKVVYREMPVLGQPSYDAAKASLAAAQQGKYMTFHKAVFAAGRPSPSVIAAAQRQAGIDPAAARDSDKLAAIDAELTKSSELQRILSLSGTPSWVIGKKVVVGSMDYDQLKAAIAAARAGK